MERLQIPQKLVYENFTYTKKFYIHEIAPVNLSKIYFLKNAKKTCKPTNQPRFKSPLNNPEWYSIKQERATYCEQVSLEITNKSCYRGLKHFKLTGKKNKAK